MRRASQQQRTIYSLTYTSIFLLPLHLLVFTYGKIVNYKPGFYVADLVPRWWNSTASEQLQLLIIQAGDAPFLATLPAGPVLTATYAAPSTGVPASSNSPSPRGKVAAAVIVPLLVVAALAAFFWIRRSRAKGKEKSHHSSICFLGAQEASRLSRSEEVYGEYGFAVEGPEYRISMRSASRNGSGWGSVSAGKTSFESGGFEDVGPALTMMRVQGQEQEQQNYHAHRASVASAAFAAGASETLFTASPSPYQTSFSSAVPSTLSNDSSPTFLNSHNSHNANSAASSLSSNDTGLNKEDDAVFTGMAPPKNGSSPDDMLRAYAERKAAAAASAGSSSISPASPASPVSGPGGNGHGHGRGIGGIGGKLKTLKGKMSVPSPLGRRFLTEAREVRGERGERERGEKERDGSESGHGHAM
ncbi:hypothetical protein BDP27DRAFT_1481752 [Rhodocollybia butyracea]|uniref:Uncharacterized protein n=1 Tax=Rhodocollybia butyracea TaxID=206335 RepID=A0A9P5PG43_9AGAR|nr:hypothetical protein BDP27DRAFT_1481752 [Rhodocollybia butyracea]